ncbi:unnamed protein product [Notodromas monacha]|uniref:Signal transducing adapter molecule 1 n=1 Tax=Notodromas monacha TaxID=399045 RepID=A0A7R9BBX4_9CRUS|nr:unnamed protein product [Notodromas monacha]CAG0912369.1 unnamed protein product [Notodromas monacha]
MPWYSGSSPFDADVERLTDKNNTTENWGVMLDLCDRVGTSQSSCKNCLKSITKRLHSEVPHVQKQALTLLDTCINNCGKAFLLEVASRDFEIEIKRLITKGHPGIADKTKAMLKKWAEGEFKTDPTLNLIPALYNKLQHSGVDFPAIEETKSAKSTKTTGASVAQKEADDLAKAIELSLQETKKSAGASVVDAAKSPVSLYPSAKIGTSSVPAKEPRKVRALYDFEAAEDNELTFFHGEIILVLDDSDTNWWKGSNHRGEGLFPANFVTSDLSDAAKESPSSSRKVQFRESVEVRTMENEEEEEDDYDRSDQKVVQIDEEKMRKALKLITEGDPSGTRPDPPELAILENECYAMGPAIDTELEKIDKKHSLLSRLSADLVEALNLYHTLMRSSYSTEGMAAPVRPPYAPSTDGMMPYMPPAAPYQSPPPQMYMPYPAPQQHQPPQQYPMPEAMPGYPQYGGYVPQQPGLPQPQQLQANTGYYPANPSGYYAPYPAPGAVPMFDPTKMMPADSIQTQQYMQPMSMYDPTMAGQTGLEASYAAMSMATTNGHPVNSGAPVQPQPPLL